MLIKVAGTNAVKPTDLLTRLPSSAVVTHAAAAHAVATDMPLHHDLVDTAHALAVDHGLYG